MATRLTGAGGSSDQTGNNKAKGVLAHAEGYTALASGDDSHAEGWGTTASGAEAHAEGQSTTASNSGSHAEGFTTTASGTYAHAEGYTTTASANGAHAEGQSTTASGTGAHAEGDHCVASGNSSHAQGLYAAATRYGQHAQAAGGIFVAAGDAQTSTFVASRSTTDATVSQLIFNGGTSATLTGTNANVLTIPVNRAHQFRVSVVARRDDVSGDAAGWAFSGLVARGSSGSAALVGTLDARAWGSAGAAAWDVTVSVDTSDSTNNYLAVTVTGEAAKTIHWVARIETVEAG